MAIRKWVSKHICVNKDGSYSTQMCRSGKNFYLNGTTYEEAIKFRDEINEKYPSRAKRYTYASGPDENLVLCQKLISRIFVICEKCERLTGDGKVYTKDGNDAPEAFGVLCPTCEKEKDDSLIA